LVPTPLIPLPESELTAGRLATKQKLQHVLDALQPTQIGINRPNR
jgi:hypothetical protein